jgi:hypothetical protein
MQRKVIALVAGFLAMSPFAANAQTSVTWTATPGATGSQYYARSGDFNGDGLSDIAMPVTGGGPVRMKINTGTGFTGSDWPFSAGLGWPVWNAVNVGDFNCDGRDDFAWFSGPGGNNVVKVLENNSLGGSNSFTSFDYTFNFGGPSLSIDHTRTRIGDANGDNCSDIFVVDTGGAIVSILTKSFGRTFNRTGPLAINSSWGPGERVLLGDFDCDGRVDDFAAFNPPNVYMKYYDQTTSSFVNMTGANPTAPGSAWGWAGYYAKSGKFTSVLGGGLADCSWDVAIPVGNTILIKQNNQTGFVDETVNTPNWSNVQWSVTNQWNSFEWTFAGNFDGNDRIDFASVAGAPVYMKFAP